jgi:hypothetical protein
MADHINPERQRIVMNSALHVGTTPSANPQNLEHSRQKAIQSIASTKQRSSADREVASQVPLSSRSRSESRADRPRVPKSRLDALNEYEESVAPSQQSAGIFQNGRTSHALEKDLPSQLTRASQPDRPDPITYQSHRLPGSFGSSFVGDSTHAPMFQNDTDRDSALSADDVSVSHDKPIDDTLLDIGKDFELNLNEIVTNVLRQKSNSLIDTLEEFSALDAKDFAAKVATRSYG